MTTQRQEIIAAEKMCWPEEVKQCECGNTAKSGSCYCQICEDEIYGDLDEEISHGR